MLHIHVVLSTFLVQLFSTIGISADLVLNDQFKSQRHIDFSQEWKILGPFRIGTREAIWGADPLEVHGGFPDLEYDDKASYRSALTANASVKWSMLNAHTIHASSQVSTVSLIVDHPEVDWDFAQKAYGWSALQYQTWVRGYLHNNGVRKRKVLLYPQSILELHVNGHRFFGGDVYNFTRAPILINLLPGPNKLDLRLVRDVRILGGAIPPTIMVQIQAKIVLEGISFDKDHIVAPDLVDGILPSHYFSIPLTNLFDTPVVIEQCCGSRRLANAWVDNDSELSIAPGQTRPVRGQFRKGFARPEVSGAICYRVLQGTGREEQAELDISFNLKSNTITEPHKFTFLHPSGAVSYAVLQPPKVMLSAAHTRPLLLGLHGAGVEADSELVRHTLDAITDLEAFVLSPSGMTSWAGDDWHIWGHADAMAAIDAVHTWIDCVKWNGSTPSTRKVMVIGHSNGGQGAWLFASHMPDKTLAAAPVSGYTYIESYVPYNFWAEADPLKSAMISAARVPFKNELHLDNVLDIPILQQHGSKDDNVPPYHSRLMSTLRDMKGSRSDYFELKGKGHWFDGALTTQPLQDFYRKYLNREPTSWSPVDRFRVVSSAIQESGSRHGVRIEQLTSPDRLGHVDIEIYRNSKVPIWNLYLSNVRRLRINLNPTQTNLPLRINFAGHGTSFDIVDLKQPFIFTMNKDDQWTISELPTSLGDRIGAQVGAMDSILRTPGTFQIIAEDTLLPLATQVSRNMLQYFGADSEIKSLDRWFDALFTGGNIITLIIANGTDVPPSLLSTFPITFDSYGLKVRSRLAPYQRIMYEEGLGAAMLRPLPDERLELLIWGYDLQGLQNALRLIPTLTGAGQPDFVILDKSAAWQGVEGARAIGLFDYAWEISYASYTG